MNQEQPLVSVITPAYNAERFIGETIESVLAQTYTNWEMIIVDDCSTDRTVEIVQAYMEKDDRIKLFQLEKNSGAGVARNRAMDEAKGRFIAFLDSDDLWLPEKLSRQIPFMLDNGLAFTFTKYERISEDGQESKGVTEAPATVHYEDLMKHCVIGCLTVVLDRSKIGEQRMLEIRTRQDYAFWLSLTRQGFIAYGLPEVLARYRLVENSISSNKVKAARQNWQLYYEIEDQPLWKSLWYFTNYATISVAKLLEYRFKQ